MWKGRKSAFAAMGRLAPNYIVQDGVIPRNDIARVLAEIARLSRGARAAGRQRLPRRRRQPASAGALRRQDRRGRSTPPRSWPGRSSGSASATAGRSPASTAWARTRRRTWRRCSARTTWTPWPRCAAPSTPARSSIPARCSPRPRLCGDRPGVYRPHPTERPGWRTGDERAAARASRQRARCARGRWPRPPRRWRRRPAPRSRVLFVGGGTELGLGPLPSGVDVLFRTDGLDRVVEHAPLDQIVVVEAGVTRRERCRRLLGAHGQMLALDPPWAGTGHRRAASWPPTPSAPGAPATAACGT